MKIKTALNRIFEPIKWGNGTTHDQYVLSETLLKKYKRKFGSRHFTQNMRMYIKNGLWETATYKELK